MSKGSPSSDFDQEFGALYYQKYDEYKRTVFEPALEVLNRALQSLVNKEFSESQQRRIRVEQGRIKDRNRLLLKAGKPKYKAQVKSPDDIFSVVRDIVGTRVTCNTLSDVRAVVKAIKEAVAVRSPNQRTLGKKVRDWEDDYISSPKESGYRAVNLVVYVRIPSGKTTRHVTCEVQVRTLLQDAWGELTHEDTYKPGVTPPALVQILSKRLATALAVLDEIAQDLRDELDKVAVSGGGALPTSPVPSLGNQRDDFDIAAVPEDGVLPTTPVLSPRQDETYTQGRVPSNQSFSEITDRDINSAFENAYGRQASLNPDEIDVISRELSEARITSANTLQTILVDTKSTIETIKQRYPDYDLSDAAWISWSIAIYSDSKNGAARLDARFQKAVIDDASKREGEETFADKYRVGDETFGTVVYAQDSYALVQLPEGDTGIVHYTKMSDKQSLYIRVTDFLREGDTIRVRIVSVDPGRQRIELALPESERKARGL